MSFESGDVVRVVKARLEDADELGRTGTVVGATTERGDSGWLVRLDATAAAPAFVLPFATEELELVAPMVEPVGAVAIAAKATPAGRTQDAA